MSRFKPVVARWTQPDGASETDVARRAVSELPASASRRGLRITGRPRFAWMREAGAASVLVAVAPAVDVGRRPVAPCVEDPDRWFPSEGARWYEARCAPAIEACMSECPVETREQCLADVMRAERGMGISERNGVFAGLMPLERLALDCERNPDGVVVSDDTVMS